MQKTIRHSHWLVNEILDFDWLIQIVITSVDDGKSPLLNLGLLYDAWTWLLFIFIFIRAPCLILKRIQKNMILLLLASTWALSSPFTSRFTYEFSEADKARAVAAVHDVAFEEFGWVPRPHPASQKKCIVAATSHVDCPRTRTSQKPPGML